MSYRPVVVYANSLLATLNTRASLSGKAQDSERESVHLTSLRIGSVTSTMFNRSRAPTEVRTLSSNYYMFPSAISCIA